MKKIPYILSSLALAFAFTACHETQDDAPVLERIPGGGGYQEFLNTPEMADQYIVLTKDSQSGYLHMTCSQPDYGFAAAATYTAQVSLSSDFSSPMVEGQPASVNLSTTFIDCAEINLSNAELASAMMDMLAIESPDQVPTPYYPLYIRLVSQIFNGSTLINNTTVYSNVVSIKGVSLDYVASVEPGLPSGIYIRGGMNGWGTDNEFLTTTEAGVYVAEDISMPAGTEFKVAVEDWSDPNCGTNGNAISFNTPYTMDNSSNSGNITCPADFMGEVYLQVAGGKYTITLVPYEPETPGMGSNIFLVGGFEPSNWGFDDPSLEFITTAYKYNWVIEHVTVPGGSKFKVAYKGWGDPNCGGMDTEFQIGVPYTMFNDGGSGDIEMPANFSGKVYLRQKNGDYIVTFIPDEE